MTNRGICASSVRDFLRALDDHHYRLHALMIQQGDELLYADAAAPYTLDTPHRLCSAAKSILSLNVLLAAQEGKLRFDDRVADYFPEFEVSDPLLKDMTVEDLLTMRTGQVEDPFIAMLGDLDSDIITPFFQTPAVDKPGVTFRYNNTVPHIVYAVAERAMGVQIEPFQNERLCRPLGASLHAPTNSKGQYNPVITCASANSLMAFGRLYLNEGRWNGQQIIDASLMRRAMELRADPMQPEVTSGYGYQLWGNPFGGIRMDGGWGQYAVILPEYDAVIVLLSDMTDSSYAMKAVEAYLLPGLEKGAEEGQAFPPVHSIAPVGHAQPAIQQAQWQLEDGRMLRMEAKAEEVILQLDEETFRIGLNDAFARNPKHFLAGRRGGLDHTAYGFDPDEMLLGGAWTDGCTLDFVGKCFAEMGECRYQLRFDQDTCTLSYPEASEHGIATLDHNRLMKGALLCKSL